MADHRLCDHQPAEGYWTVMVSTKSTSREYILTSVTFRTRLFTMAYPDPQTIFALPVYTDSLESVVALRLPASTETP
jgi:hypothetical protein